VTPTVDRPTPRLLHWLFGTTVNRGAQRFRRIHLTAGAAIGFRGAVLLSGFIYIPLTVRYLGPERYGLWVAMTSIMALLAFADCGIGYSLMNDVAYAIGRDRGDDIRKAISSTFFVLFAVAFGGCCLFAMAYRFIPWQQIFQIGSPSDTAEASKAVAVMVVSFLLTLPFTVVQRIQSAYQEGFETQVWEILGVAASLGGLLVAIHMQAGLPVLAIVFSAGPLLAVVLNWVAYFFIRRPSLRPAFRLADTQLARRIVREGFHFFILQISTVVVFSFDSFVVLHYFGNIALGKYSLVAKLFQVAPALAGVWFAPLWPAYAEAIARGDHQWVRRVVTWSTVTASIACAVVCSALALITRQLVHLWIGTDVSPSSWLLAGFVVYSILMVGAGSIAAFLNGSNFIKEQAVLVVSTAALSIALKIGLCKYGSQAGAVWGTNLAYLLLVIPAYCVIVPRLMKQQVTTCPHQPQPWREPLIGRVRHFLRHAIPTLVIAALNPRRHWKEPAEPPRILVTRIDGMGDFVMCIPLLRELRRKFPDSYITLAVGRNAIGLALPCPYVNQVFAIDSSPKDTSSSSYLKYLWTLALYLRNLLRFSNEHLVGRIDLAIQPRWDVDLHWATLITFLSGAPRRIGYSENNSMIKSWCNFGHDRLFTDVLIPGLGQHEVDRNLDVVRYLGGPVENTSLEIWWSVEDEHHADRFLLKHNVPSNEVCIGFGIGAANARRQWPFFPDLIRLVSGKMKFTPVLFAGPGEERIADEIRAEVPSAVVMQNMPIGVTAAVLARLTLFVGNDSGPIHLAAGAGLPVVEISPHPWNGSHGHENDPDRFGPFAARKSIVRPKAFTDGCSGGCIKNIPHCIASITPEEVAVEVLELAQSLSLRTITK